MASPNGKPTSTPQAPSERPYAWACKAAKVYGLTTPTERLGLIRLALFGEHFESDTTFAREIGSTRQTVNKLRSRFVALGLAVKRGHGRTFNYVCTYSLCVA